MALRSHNIDSQRLHVWGTFMRLCSYTASVRLREAPLGCTVLIPFLRLPSSVPQSDFMMVLLPQTFVPELMAFISHWPLRVGVPSTTVHISQNSPNPTVSLKMEKEKRDTGVFPRAVLSALKTSAVICVCPRGFVFWVNSGAVPTSKTACAA